MIVTSPGDTPVARPDALTVAMEGLLLLQLMVAYGFAWCDASKATPVNCWVAPTRIDTDAGVTSTLATGGGTTWSCAVPTLPSAVAVIITSPGTTPVARPDALMVAMEELLLLQLMLALEIGLCIASKATPVNCWQTQ